MSIKDIQGLGITNAYLASSSHQRPIVAARGGVITRAGLLSLLAYTSIVYTGHACHMVTMCVSSRVLRQEID